MKNAEMLKGFWLEKLKDVKTIPKMDFKKYLSVYEDYNCQFTSIDTNGDYILTFNDFSEVPALVLGDYLNYSRVAFQSLEKIPNALTDKNLSWAIVKSYYSAFYSAHAIMRLSGYYFTYYDGSIIKNINVHSTARPKDLSVGTYLVRLDPSIKQITLKSLGKKTSHEGMWEQFGFFLDDLEKFLIQEYSSGSILFRDQLKTVKNILEKESNCSFLTSFRNEVNYLNDLSFWNSVNLLGDKILTSFDNRKKKWKEPTEDFVFSDVENDFINFQEVVIYLMALVKESFLELNRISPNNKIYGRMLSNGYLGFSI